MNSADGFGAMAERHVRFTDQFFDRLDVLLPFERDELGTPSVTDFLVLEAPRLRDRLAADFEGSTMPTGDPEVRVAIGTGTIIPYVALFAYLAQDGAVEVFWLSIDLTPL
ncbi:MAG TPA: hypothetical protein PLV13_09510 [Ilumatobacteraceae bacterium]|nr:hypothetical protein [Ilumatobacteraceae bacterium]